MNWQSVGSQKLIWTKSRTQNLISYLICCPHQKSVPPSTCPPLPLRLNLLRQPDHSHFSPHLILRSSSVAAVEDQILALKPVSTECPHILRLLWLNPATESLLLLRRLMTLSEALNGWISEVWRQTRTQSHDGGVVTVFADGRRRSERFPGGGKSRRRCPDRSHPETELKLDFIPNYI